MLIKEIDELKLLKDNIVELYVVPLKIAIPTLLLKFVPLIYP